MKAAVVRVVEALRAAGVETSVTEFAESTRTAEEAAAAVGATVGQIVKSLVFVTGEQPVLALVSGANRLDTQKLAALTGGRVRRADADLVRDATGFAIGGGPANRARQGASNLHGSRSAWLRPRLGGSRYSKCRVSHHASRAGAHHRRPCRGSRGA